MNRLLVAALLGLGLALVAWTARDRFSQDLTALLPENDPLLARQVAFFTRQTDTRILAVEARGEAGRTLLTELPPRLASLGAKPLISDDPNGLLQAANVVLTQLPELTPLEDLPEVQRRLEPEVLRATLSALKERISRPDDLLTAAAARRDPLGLAGEIMRTMAPSGEQVGILRRHRDGDHWLLVLAVDFSPEDLGRSTALLDALADPRLTIVGSYRHYRENLDTVRRDLLASLPLSAVLIVALAWSLLGSWRGVVLVHVPAIVGVLGALASGAAWSWGTNRAIPLPMLGFAAALLGIAVDYGTHVCCACRAGNFAAVRRPLLLGYLTTALAFAVLWASPVPGLRLLGVLVVGGLGAALLTSLLVLPHWCQGLPTRDPWRGISLAILAWSDQRRWQRITVAGLLTLLLAPGLSFLSAEGDLRRLDGSKPGTWATLGEVLGRWGNLDTSVALVTEAPTVEAALQHHAAARHLLGAPVALSERLLPGLGEQHRRRAAWASATATLPERFAAACTAVGLRAAAFDLSAYRVNPDAAPGLSLESWATTPLARLLRTQLQPTAHGWQVSTPLTGQAAALEAQLPPNSPSWIAARTTIGSGLIQAVRSDLAARIPLIVGAIFILIAIVERRPRRVLAILAPPTLALVWTFGLLGWLGQPLTPLSLLAAAFIGGIGIDSALFLAARREASGLSPVLAATATTLAGTVTLACATHPLIQSVGLALTLGMTMCLFACVLLTPTQVEEN